MRRRRADARCSIGKSSNLGSAPVRAPAQIAWIMSQPYAPEGFGVAGLYNALGFWPAVLFFPALGLLGITPMASKLRAVNATRSMITGPQ